MYAGRGINVKILQYLDTICVAYESMLNLPTCLCVYVDMQYVLQVYVYVCIPWFCIYLLLVPALEMSYCLSLSQGPTSRWRRWRRSSHGGILRAKEDSVGFQLVHRSINLNTQIDRDRNIIPLRYFHGATPRLIRALIYHSENGHVIHAHIHTYIQGITMAAHQLQKTRRRSCSLRWMD